MLVAPGADVEARWVIGGVEASERRAAGIAAGLRHLGLGIVIDYLLEVGDDGLKGSSGEGQVGSLARVGEHVIE